MCLKNAIPLYDVIGPFITHGATMSASTRCCVYQRGPSSEFTENPSTSSSRARGSSRKEKLQHFIVPKKKQHYPIVVGFAGQRESALQRGRWWWQCDENDREEEKRRKKPTEEPESVVNTRIYTIFISPKMESFSRHYQ